MVPGRAIVRGGAAMQDHHLLLLSFTFLILPEPDDRRRDGAFDSRRWVAREIQPGLPPASPICRIRASFFSVRMFGLPVQSEIERDQQIGGEFPSPLVRSRGR
jgi:hypothetical protein